MDQIRFIFRLFCIGGCLLYGMAEMFFLFPFYSKKRKLRAIQIWSLRVLASCGMKLKTYGSPPSEEHGQMLICNHISWLDIMAVNAAFPGVTEALQNGDTVTLFPEGTSTEGRSILPFKTSFFQAAYEAGVPLLPVLCRYPNPDGSSPNPHAAYYGDISLWQSIRAIISQPQSTVELHFLEPVAATETRQEIARAIHALLSQKQQDLG